MDGPALVMRRESSLLDDAGSGIPAAEFLRYLADLDENMKGLTRLNVFSCFCFAEGTSDQSYDNR